MATATRNLVSAPRRSMGMGCLLCTWQFSDIVLCFCFGGMWLFFCVSGTTKKGVGVSCAVASWCFLVIGWFLSCGNRCRNTGWVTFSSATTTIHCSSFMDGVSIFFSVGDCCFARNQGLTDWLLFLDSVCWWCMAVLRCWIGVAWLLPVTKRVLSAVSRGRQLLVLVSL